VVAWRDNASCLKVNMSEADWNWQSCYSPLVDAPMSNRCIRCGAKSFQRRNKVVGLTSKEVFGPGCLLTCEGFQSLMVLLSRGW